MKKANTALLALLSACAMALAQQTPPLTAEPPTPRAKPRTGEEAAAERARADELAQRAAEAYERGAYEESEGLLRQQMALQPGNFVVLYNLACCRARLEDDAGALRFIYEAVEHGFTDLGQLRREPAFERLRKHNDYQRLVAGWRGVLEARRDANVEANRRLFRGRQPDVVSDEKLRLVYLSAFDQKSLDDARGEITSIAAWAERQVFPGILDDGGSVNDPWVCVCLPERDDYLLWVASVYGPNAVVGGATTIGGAYEHDRKRLVAQDLGPTLRHEFLHVLHWRSMMRLGQVHAAWVQEGLCSLIEDYDIDAMGNIQPAHSWRTNMVKRMERVNGLMKLSDLANLTMTRFSASRPLANYAHSRAVFMYLWQEDKLREWYGAYTAGYAEDPTGVAALEKVLGKPIEEIDKDFRYWVKTQPNVPEEIAPGKASLGVEVDSGTGEGPIVLRTPTRRSGIELKTGDVITAINGRPTRDIAELVRVLGGYHPGQEVEVAFRRGRNAMTTTIKLIAKR